MKSFAYFYVFLTTVLLAILQEEVSGQAYHPTYGSVPIPYNNYEDDDLGLLLTVLLLATKNKNNCCNCCDCAGTAKTIPVPFPIPIPTSTSIVNKPVYDSDDDDDSDENDDKDNKDTKDCKGKKDDMKPSSDAKSNKFEKEDMTTTIRFVPVPIESAESGENSKEKSKKN